MLDPSTQTCKIRSEYLETNLRESSGVYEELPLFMLEQIYKTEEQKAWLKDCIVARPGPIFFPCHSKSAAPPLAWIYSLRC